MNGPSPADAAKVSVRDARRKLQSLRAKLKRRYIAQELMRVDIDALEKQEFYAHRDLRLALVEREMTR